ncbi:MAG: beta-N-acetylhexosaminidase [Phycisphaerae bacterium]|nr:beta-N-acetylhexosaminidase [Phycisphaerales bacterium]
MIIPKPLEFKQLTGSFQLDRECVIGATDDGNAETLVGEYLHSLLVRPPFDIPLEVSHFADSASKRTIRLVKKPASDGNAEQYELKVSDGGIQIVASTDAGLTRGVQSLYQLALQQVNDQSNVAIQSVSLPAIEMTDKPRFVWRGMHLDVSRHFFPVDDIKRYLDLLAAFKFNVFHWHLTDDQGWRLEIEQYPELTRVGSAPNVSEPGRSGFYTKSQIREVIEYAAQRHIEVIPEIDLPGHTQAVLAAYPKLSCTGGPFEVSPKSGIHKDVLCVGNEDTFKLVFAVLDEIAELFVSGYIHLGGDECPTDRWKECKKCQKRWADEKLKDENDLQGYFTRRVVEHLKKINRVGVFWDEVLERGLPAGHVLMSWRGMEHGIQAAKLGHKVVMSPHTHCYFDFKQTNDPDEHGATWADPITLEEVYAFDPIPSELDAKSAHHVLGGQANVWTERMPDMKTVEMMVLPRMCGLSEAIWSDAKHRNWDDFRKRLAAIAPWLTKNYNVHKSIRFD